MQGGNALSPELFITLHQNTLTEIIWDDIRNLISLCYRINRQCDA